MRVLVTGGSGFIGSNLAFALQQKGDDVIITTVSNEQPVAGFSGKRIAVSFYDLDWSALGKVDCVFHEAAINDTTLMDEQIMMRINVDAARTLFEHAIANGCKRVVYASSTAAYGDTPCPFKEDGPLHPLNPYGKSKQVMDVMAMDLAKKYPDVIIVGLRYCNVYGPGESHKGKRASMIYQLAQQMKSGDPKVFKFGEHTRDFIYVADVVSANLLAAQAKKSCVVNCGTGHPVSFNEIIAELNTVLGTNRKPIYIENPYASFYQATTRCDMTKAKALIGFVPQFDLKKGLQAYKASGCL